jgi:hypothetical protein
VTGQNGTGATPGAPAALRVTGGSGGVVGFGTQGTGGGINLVALLIEAVKSQQAEIERLKSQMAQLRSTAGKQ